MNKQLIVEQNKLAFEYLQKLYFEVSFFIKEIEGLLAKENEEFIIGRPGGYQMSTNHSNGLEPVNVELWVLRKLAVFFVPKEFTHQKGGTTITKIESQAKILYLRIVLDGKDIKEPIVYSGVLSNFKKKAKNYPEKIEQLMTHIEYRESQVFKNPLSIEYEDGYLAFQGKLAKHNLFDMNSSTDIYEKIVTPALQIFRSDVKK